MRGKERESNGEASPDSDPEIERQVHDAMREAGWVVPESDEDVFRAESELASTSVNRPDTLADPERVLKPREAATPAEPDVVGFPRRDRRPSGRLVLLAAAAVLLACVLGFWLLKDAEDPIRDLAMLSLEGTRSEKTEGWRPGERFAIKVLLAEDLHFHLVHFDGEEVEFFFPWYDPDTDQWSYLGHVGNRFAADEEITLPSESFADAVEVSGSTGSVEFFVGFVSREKVATEDLKRLRENLRREAEAGREAGEGPNEVVERRLQPFLAEGYPTRGIRYRIGKTD